jgi:hypothetical protein
LFKVARARPVVPTSAIHSSSKACLFRALLQIIENQLRNIDMKRLMVMVASPS